jgi:hypothetical protein
VNPNISRRALVDRVIWTKPLAFAADAVGYGFCLGDSKFVRVLCALTAAVSEVSWSLHSGGEAVPRGFFTMVSAGWGWAAASRDTTVVRAEARAVESGMDGLLGRVKGWAPHH